MKCLVGAKNACRAMTLVEVMVCAVIGALALAVAMKVWIFTACSFAAMQNYADLDRCSQNALDLMSRDARQSKALVSFTTNSLVFSNLDGSTPATFSYTYNPTAKTLTRVYGSDTKVLLHDCDYLTFAISQRCPSNNFTFYSVTDPTGAKLIDVAWKCSRQIYGQKVNTESMQSAKIVIRN
jgi:prepilin-type N-terminal cleavage/methylation domain-containing protein